MPTITRVRPRINTALPILRFFLEFLFFYCGRQSLSRCRCAAIIHPCMTSANDHVLVEHCWPDVHRDHHPPFQTELFFIHQILFTSLTRHLFPILCSLVIGCEHCRRPIGWVLYNSRVCPLFLFSLCYHMLWIVLHICPLLFSLCYHAMKCLVCRHTHVLLAHVWTFSTAYGFGPEFIGTLFFHTTPSLFRKISCPTIPAPDSSLSNSLPCVVSPPLSLH